MFNSKCSGMVLTIRVILLVSYKKQELLNLHGYPVHPQWLAVIFSHHQVCVKKKKGGHLLGPKVKVEFRHPFRFENGLIFGLPIKLMQISMFFCWLTGLLNRFWSEKRSRNSGNSRLKIQSEDKQNKGHWQ